MYGESTKNNLIAIVVPDETAAKKWMSEQSDKDGEVEKEQTLEQLVVNKELRKHILDEVRVVNITI